jgi:hypothetical protein
MLVFRPYKPWYFVRILRRHTTSTLPPETEVGTGRSARPPPFTVGFGYKYWNLEYIYLLARTKGGRFVALKVKKSEKRNFVYA